MTTRATKLVDVNGCIAHPSKSPVASTEMQCTVEIVSPDQLCGQLADRWEELRCNDSRLTSPYFNIEFTKAVARVRDDVNIAIAIEDGVIVGILPFQLNSARHAVPVGGRLNDWHGMIGRESDEILKKIMKTADLKSYAFHAMTSESPAFREFRFEEAESHHMDLSGGWDVFRKWIRQHSSTVKRQGQKTRKLEREVGPIRFEFDCEDAMVLESLIEMKRSKYQRSKTFDILSVEWAADLLREVHLVRQKDFQGLLSAMWAGDQLIGVHFGMLTKDILHYWFPVYDPKFSQYSPGTEMMEMCAKAACEQGVKKLDLGYGDDAYKFKFCNGHEPIICGQVNYSPLGFRLAKKRHKIRKDLKKIPLKNQAKRVLRKVCPGFGGWNFR